jgi:hypothetical protein
MSAWHSSKLRYVLTCLPNTRLTSAAVQSCSSDASVKAKLAELENALQTCKQMSELQLKYDYVLALSEERGKQLELTVCQRRRIISV